MSEGPFSAVEAHIFVVSIRVMLSENMPLVVAHTASV